MRATVAARHPAQELPVWRVSTSPLKGEIERENVPVVHNEVCKRKLMRVEQERRDAHREDGYPEVRDPSRPDRQRHVEQHDERAHAEVDTRACETREQDAEADATGGEPTTGSDVTRTTEGQVAEYGVRLDLGGENFEDGRQRHELLEQTPDGAPGTTLDEF